MNESSAYVNTTSGRQGQLVSDGRARGVAIEFGHNFPVLSLNSHSQRRRMLKLQGPWKPSLSNGESPVIKTLPTFMSSSELSSETVEYRSNNYFLEPIFYS